MNKQIIILAMSLFTLIPTIHAQQNMNCCQTGEEKTQAAKQDIYSFVVETSNGEQLSLADYRGKVVLIVNTASKCGFTPQFDGLEKLYKAHQAEGFVVLGFPSGDFANQEFEDGSKAENFCKLNYGVTFPIMQKVHVNGTEEEPVFTFLKSQKGFAGWNKDHSIYPALHNMFSKADPDYEQKPDIKWNFTKFLIGKDGTVVKRYEPTSEPADIEADIIEELKK